MNVAVSSQQKIIFVQVYIFAVRADFQLVSLNILLNT